ncbi:MAG: Metallo-dependent phosphatase-like protein [Benjaminiella poitrasii]|nr:MAG: Metallo-dependent phosphatase-like protein [Benjaminiella poitrasii]
MKTKAIVQLSRLIWVLFILYNECIIFWSSARRCNGTTSHDKRARFMLVGDPQMTDDRSYNRHAIIMFFTKYYSQLYMKRNYKYLTKTLHPTDVFIMGDLMDSGRDWNDEFYATEVARFRSIFPTDIDTYYMVGNHDIGFGNGVQKSLVDRFEQHFGPTSYVFEKYDYTFIVLDTVSLSSDDPTVRSRSSEVLSSLANNITTPRILFTHVPLHRLANQTCGPHRQERSKPTIRDGAGFQYQNLLLPSLSRQVLDTVQPIAVFSGDDHDYCKIVHQYRDDKAAVEITVPTFSMAQGLEYPGIMTLDIARDGQLSTRLCWLPSQIGLFLHYVYLLASTLLFLFIWHLYLYFSSKGQKAAITASSSLYQPVSNLDSLLPRHTNEMTYSRSLRRCMISYFCSILDIAWIPLMTYIICNLFF